MYDYIVTNKKISVTTTITNTCKKNNNNNATVEKIFLFSI